MGRAEDLFEKIKKEGESAINDFILTRKSEELFLDFKTSADRGSGNFLHHSDRKNLAKAISGFGNSEGGVLIWGVSDIVDIAAAKVPLEDVKKFVSMIESAVSGCTIPPHNMVLNYSIPTNDREEGFVVTFIAKSDSAPFQNVDDYKYYMRAGSSFKPVTHSILAGMFGRRPQPKMFSVFVIEPIEISNNEIKVKVGFMLRNQGPGIASDLFFNVACLKTVGKNCQASYELTAENEWLYHSVYGINFNVISKNDIRLAPEAETQPFVFIFSFKPPFEKGLEIDGICGCGQSSPHKFKIVRNVEEIELLYSDIMEKYMQGVLTKEDRYYFVQKMMSTEAKRRNMELDMFNFEKREP